MLAVDARFPNQATVTAAVTELPSCLATMCSFVPATWPGSTLKVKDALVLPSGILTLAAARVRPGSALNEIVTPPEGALPLRVTVALPASLGVRVSFTRDRPLRLGITTACLASLGQMACPRRSIN